MGQDLVDNQLSLCKVYVRKKLVIYRAIFFFQGSLLEHSRSIQSFNKPIESEQRARGGVHTQRADASAQATRAKGETN